MKRLIKSLIPPIILTGIKPAETKKELWSGNYLSWNEAKTNCTGYDSDAILEKCKGALLKVKTGEAVYERDSILFDEIQYSWGLLAGLQKAALENDGKLCVLDFGGSLGSTYYQNREFLGTLKTLQWNIVEQSNFVTCGKKYFEDEQLRFYFNIESCITEQKPNVILVSSVLQYLENPFEILEQLMKVNAPYLILDRLALTNEEQDILTIQNVPEEFYGSRLAHWFFSYTKLLKKINLQYNLLASSPSFSDKSILLNNKIQCRFDLLIFKKK